MAAFCFLLPPRYDAPLRAIDGGLFYFHVSYLMKAVYSFTAGRGGEGEGGRGRQGRKGKYQPGGDQMAEEKEIKEELEGKDWS